MGAVNCHYIAIYDVWYGGTDLCGDVAVNAASANGVGQASDARRASDFGSLKKAAADESSAIADGGGAMVVAKISATLPAR